MGVEGSRLGPNAPFRVGQGRRNIGEVLEGVLFIVDTQPSG